MTRALRLTGMFTVGVIVTVAQPDWSVRTSPRAWAHAYGSAVTLTSASRTTKPRVSATWNRPMNGARLLRRVGVNLTLSMISRSGSPTLDAGTDVWPLDSLMAPCGPGVVTTAVCADVAAVEPLA